MQVVKYWAIAFLFLVAASRTAVAQTPQRFNVEGPTIIAFFVGGDRLSDNDEPNNEVLGDFQLYFMQAKAPLQKLGVQLLDTSSPAFHIRAGNTRTSFHPKSRVGYYFIAPNKKPRIEYGVHTDDQLVQIAREYFAIP